MSTATTIPTVRRAHDLRRHAGMFVAGLAVPLALARDVGPRAARRASASDAGRREHEARGNRLRRIKRHDLPLVAKVTVAWATLFAVVHLYWAAGGAIGTNGDPTDTPAAQAYIAFIAALGIVGAAVARAHVRARGALESRRWPTLLARAGGVVLNVGVAVSVGGWLTQGGLGGDGVAGIVITAYFLLGGILFSRLGWRDVTTGPRRLARRSAHRNAPT